MINKGITAITAVSVLSFKQIKLTNAEFCAVHESNYSSAGSISLSAAEAASSAESTLAYEFQSHQFTFCKAALGNKR